MPQSRATPVTAGAFNRSLLPHDTDREHLFSATSPSIISTYRKLLPRILQIADIWLLAICKIHWIAAIHPRGPIAPAPPPWWLSKRRGPSARIRNSPMASPASVAAPKREPDVYAICLEVRRGAVSRLAWRVAELQVQLQTPPSLFP